MAQTYTQRTERLIRLWQKRLSLRDWTIEVQVCTEVDADDSWGEATWYPDSREATIRISRGLGPWQHEATVVHELLHLMLQGHMDYEGYDIHEERAINTLASVLTAAYRGRARE